MSPGSSQITAAGLAGVDTLCSGAARIGHKFRAASSTAASKEKLGTTATSGSGLVSRANHATSGGYIQFDAISRRFSGYFGIFLMVVPLLCLPINIQLTWSGTYRSRGETDCAAR